jgi:Asp-tRNA(Asn)/Glu-tRNA(Gln) amidotransferase A subunit family amidase
MSNEDDLRSGITRRRFLQSTALSVSALSTYAVGQTDPARAVPTGGRALLELSAIEAVSLLRSGDLSSERYAQALLEQCRAYRALNAFTWQDETQVLETARAADRRRSSQRPGALHGLPILLKANIGTVNAPTSAGTPALRDHRPPADAPVAAKLFSAGAVLLGKTNMHELAYGITSNNRAFGAVHNPYNPALIPGGSSGGNGAALAARMCAAGIGTDTGGSVRIPAALCGIVGLRPTVGRYPAKGIVPLSHTRDTAGPMARSVADLVLLDSTITGESASLSPATLKGVRLGVPHGYFYDNMDATLAPVIDNAIATLRRAGCVLVEANIPDLERSYAAARLPIVYYEMLHDLSSYLREAHARTNVRELIAQIVSPDVKAAYDTFVVGPRAPTREEYEVAMSRSRPALQAAYRDFFRTHNVAAMVFPTTLLPARPIGQDDQVELNGKKVGTFGIYLHNTVPMTIAGIPGISLPVGLTAAGLPVGLELDAPSGRDRSLLSLGLAIERLFEKLPGPRL